MEVATFVFFSLLMFSTIKYKLPINMNKAYLRVVMPLFSHSFLIFSRIYSKLCACSHLENVINDNFPL